GVRAPGRQHRGHRPRHRRGPHRRGLRRGRGGRAGHRRHALARRAAAGGGRRRCQARREAARVGGRTVAAGMAAARSRIRYAAGRAAEVRQARDPAGAPDRTGQQRGDRARGRCRRRRGAAACRRAARPGGDGTRACRWPHRRSRNPASPLSPGTGQPPPRPRAAGLRRNGRRQAALVESLPRLPRLLRLPRNLPLPRETRAQKNPAACAAGFGTRGERPRGRSPGRSGADYLREALVVPLTASSALAWTLALADSIWALASWAMASLVFRVRPNTSWPVLTLRSTFSRATCTPFGHTAFRPSKSRAWATSPQKAKAALAFSSNVASCRPNTFSAFSRARLLTWVAASANWRDALANCSLKSWYMVGSCRVSGRDCRYLC